MYLNTAFVWFDWLYKCISGSRRNICIQFLNGHVWKRYSNYLPINELDWDLTLKNLCKKFRKNRFKRLTTILITKSFTKILEARG